MSSRATSALGRFHQHTLKYGFGARDYFCHVDRLEGAWSHFKRQIFGMKGSSRPRESPPQAQLESSQIRKSGFALDSLLEEAAFEPSVPRERFLTHEDKVPRGTDSAYEGGIRTLGPP
jgi:hypothetical protein